MTPPITALLLNYKRTNNVHFIISRLRRQSVPIDIFVWDNSGKFRSTDVDWLINSSVNALCAPRWFMGTYARTPYVFTLDDDLLISRDDLIEDVVSYIEKKDFDPDTIFGPFGVIHFEGRNYSESNALTQRILGVPGTAHSSGTYFFDVAADMIKGRLMMMRTDRLRQNFDHVQHLTTSEDDIIISGLFARGRRRHHRILTKFKGALKELDDYNVGEWRRVQHSGYRDATLGNYVTGHPDPEERAAFLSARKANDVRLLINAAPDQALPAPVTAMPSHSITGAVLRTLRSETGYWLLHFEIEELLLLTSGVRFRYLNGEFKWDKNRATFIIKSVLLVQRPVRDDRNVENLVISPAFEEKQQPLGLEVYNQADPAIQSLLSFFIEHGPKVADELIVLAQDADPQVRRRLLDDILRWSILSEDMLASEVPYMRESAERSSASPAPVAAEVSQSEIRSGATGKSPPPGKPASRAEPDQHSYQLSADRVDAFEIVAETAESDYAQIGLFLHGATCRIGPVGDFPFKIQAFSGRVRLELRHKEVERIFGSWTNQGHTDDWGRYFRFYDDPSQEEAEEEMQFVRSCTASESEALFGLLAGLPALISKAGVKEETETVWTERAQKLSGLCLFRLISIVELEHQ